MTQWLRLGTRKSALALKQAEIVAKLLANTCSIQTKIIPLSTPGDQDKTTPLSKIGGKGVFISTLEQALLQKDIDIAVHSLKDVTAESSQELVLAGFLKPEACEDALVVSTALPSQTTLKGLPKNARLGTGSLRRKALVRELRPDITCIDIRGNVETRIKKCDDGDLDAVMLSKAGVLRLGLEHRISETLNPYQIIPAPGQGVIALQANAQHHKALAACKAISDTNQTLISELEMMLLRKLGLGCNFPLGIYTTRQENTLTMYGFWAASLTDKPLRFELTMSQSQKEELIMKAYDIITEKK